MSIRIGHWSEATSILALHERLPIQNMEFEVPIQRFLHFNLTHQLYSIKHIRWISWESVVFQWFWHRFFGVHVVHLVHVIPLVDDIIRWWQLNPSLPRLASWIWTPWSMSIGTTRPAAQLGTEILTEISGRCDVIGMARPEFSKIHFVPFQDTLPAASGAQSSSEMLRVSKRLLQFLVLFFVLVGL